MDDGLILNATPMGIEIIRVDERGEVVTDLVLTKGAHIDRLYDTLHLLKINYDPSFTGDLIDD